MPRPLSRKETTARNRELLLDAAAKAISRAGIGGASLEQIAAEAGLTKGAVYSQFASKEDLLLALLDRRFELGHARLQEFLEADAPIGEVIGGLDQWHRGVAGEGRLWATLELELALTAARQPRLRRKLRARQEASRKLLADMIEKLAREHELALPIPAEDFAVALQAMSDGLLVHWVNDPKAVPDDLFGRFIASIVLAATRAAAADDAS